MFISLSSFMSLSSPPTIDILYSSSSFSIHFPHFTFNISFSWRQKKKKKKKTVFNEKEPKNAPFMWNEIASENWLADETGTWKMMNENRIPFYDWDEREKNEITKHFDQRDNNKYINVCASREFREYLFKFVQYKPAPNCLILMSDRASLAINGILWIWFIFVFIKMNEIQLF